MPNNPVKLLASYFEAAQEPQKKPIEKAILNMKRSQNSHLFSGILGYRYAHGIDVKKDVGGYALGHGQGYNYSNAYFKNEGAILAEWEAALNIPENLRLFKTRKMQDLLDRYHRNWRQYIYQDAPLPIPAGVYPGWILELQDDRVWTVEEDKELKRRILDLIQSHRLTEDQRRRIIEVQEDFLWTSKTSKHPGSIHWGNIFELVRYANYARFLLVFGEMFVETTYVASQLAINAAQTSSQIIAGAPPGLWHFITGLNHIGFTQMGFNVYVIQISIMVLEFSKLWYETYQESKGYGMTNAQALKHAFIDSFKNYWLKPGKASDFVNAAAWMTMGLMATFAFPTSAPLIFVVGFWFDALHAAFFLAKTVWHDNKKRLKLRAEELKDIHAHLDTDESYNNWYNRLKAVVLQQRADSEKIPDLESKIEKIKAKLTKLENGLHNVGYSRADKIRHLTDELEPLEEELSRCEQSARNPSPGDFDRRAVKAMHDIKKIHQDRRNAVKQVIGSVAIGIALAIGFSMAVYAPHPIAAAVGTAIMFATMVVFVVQKYYGLHKKRKMETHRQERDAEGEQNESKAFAKVREEVKDEKDQIKAGRKQARTDFFKSKRSADRPLVQEYHEVPEVRFGMTCC